MPKRLFGAASEFIEAKYGGPVEDLVAVVSVGTTAAEVIRNDPERVFLLFVNLSVNTMHVGFDAAVGAARGIVLAANGGTYQIDVEEDFTLPTRSHFVISTGALSNLYVLTVRRFAKAPVEAE